MGERGGGWWEERSTRKNRGLRILLIVPFMLNLICQTGMHRSPLGCRVYIASMFSAEEFHFSHLFLFLLCLPSPLPTPQTGHTHFYHRSCPAFKGGCPAPVAGKGGHTISPPVHIMVGNGGFQPGASVFNETPAWIDVESFNYGYCTVEASQTQMTLQVSSTGRYGRPTAQHGGLFNSCSMGLPAVQGCPASDFQQVNWG